MCVIFRSKWKFWSGFIMSVLSLVLFDVIS